VLAVVDHFAGAGMLVGGGAAAEIWSALEEGNAETRIGQGAGRGETGETASGDGYCRLLEVLDHFRIVANPFGVA